MEMFTVGSMVQYVSLNDRVIIIDRRPSAKSVRPLKTQNHEPSSGVIAQSGAPMTDAESISAESGIFSRYLPELASVFWWDIASDIPRPTLAYLMSKCTFLQTSGGI